MYEMQMVLYYTLLHFFTSSELCLLRVCPQITILFSEKYEIIMMDGVALHATAL